MESREIREIWELREAHTPHEISTHKGEIILPNERNFENFHFREGILVFTSLRTTRYEDNYEIKRIKYIYALRKLQREVKYAYI